MATDAPRKPRADAERNRQRLLEAAMAAFAAQGAAASLEEIARSAGVGIGTLYRHFPTRDALIEHVYRQAIGQLGEAAETLARTHPPFEALRQWLLLFVDYLATKKIMAGALNTLVAGPAELYAASGSQLQAAIAALTERAVASGDIVLDVEPLDLLRAVAGVANASPGADWQAGAKRMVAILLAGMRRA
ncbi:MAG TPA: TetR/AcrR family transcriptional regulator [Sphingomonas sp.]|uniref:TetR/AcrR family transcriptional regulator n=1 Tax=Sphingomonas sp. TaxID=28214 RepID=UPI002D1CDA9E|nr:TetR/AcrR family transcriptional regulator [Sphingomonas sp.]HMI20144.1 TetR/AcrR family transcriptional regulator [Sphingomonas sp.]